MIVGTNLRFFSERVFGAWVDGTIIAFNRKTRVLTIDAYFWPSNWKEKKPIETEFYYPHSHSQRGEAFKFEERKPNEPRSDSSIHQVP